jgi:hypothetical protein
MRYPSLSFAFLVAASLVTSACGDDPMTVDRPDAALGPDAPVATPDASPDAMPDAQAADAEPADAGPADAEPADASPPGLQLPSLGNNGGRASVSIGNGTEDLSVLRKQVALQVTGAAPELELGPAFVTRTSASSTYIYTFIRVANHGTRRRCFIHIDGQDYLDAAGGHVGHSSGGFVYGTVGAFSSGATDTCLGPGESAYVPDIEEVSYDPIATISAHILVADIDAHEPNTSIVPRDIVVTGQRLTMNAHNLGPNPGKVRSSGYWAAFDAENQPVTFSFTSPCAQDAPEDLAVGADLPHCDNFIIYRGSSTVVQARIPFLESDSAKLTATSPALRAVAASRARLRDAVAAAKRR